MDIPVEITRPIAIITQRVVRNIELTLLFIKVNEKRLYLNVKNVSNEYYIELIN
jgi:hypothetical protein